MDAIDVALVGFANQTFEIREYEQYPIAGDIRSAVRNLTAKSEIEEISKLDAQLGDLFAQAAVAIIDKAAVKVFSRMVSNSLMGTPKLIFPP